MFWMMTTMILTNECHFLKVQRSWIRKVFACNIYELFGYHFDSGFDKKK